MVSRGTDYVAMRLWQSVLMLKNGPEVLAQIMLANTRLGRPEIRLQLRNGLTVITSNSDGARVPIYEIFAEDSYELDHLMAGLPPNPVILDIGGQIGAFSLAVASHDPQARVHVYEASPVSAKFIRRNIEENALSHRITLHDCALAGERGTISFLDSGTANGLNGVTVPGWVGATTIQVRAETFGDDIRSAGVAANLVKVDVEGAEYGIILNSDPGDWKEVKRVVLEYHPVDGHGVDDLIGFFKTAGLVPEKQVPGRSEGLGLLWLIRDDPTAT